jgi:sucrose synthase
MIFSIAILSPHGWFGQSNVLGRPTPAARSSTSSIRCGRWSVEMRRAWRQGLDVEPRILVVTRLIPEADGTTCNQRIEPIAGHPNAVILRVPFRNASGEVLPHWISRFDIWPYLEQFALDAERELLASWAGGPT